MLTIETDTNGVEQRLHGSAGVPVVLGCADGMGPGPAPAGPRPDKSGADRTVAACEHIDPSGRLVRVSRHTLDHWIRVWRAGGFDALIPSPRQSSPRLPLEVIGMAIR